MKKHILNEATVISYTLVRDYYIPDLKLPETEKSNGMGRKDKQHPQQSRRNCKCRIDI